MRTTTGEKMGRRMRPNARTTGSRAGLAVLLVALAVVVERLSVPGLPGWSVGAPAWWPLAGIVFALLARCPRRRWPLVLSAAAISSLAGDLIAGVAPADAAALTVANLLGPVLAAGVVAGWRHHRPVTVVTLGSGLRLIAALLAGVAGWALVALPWLVTVSAASWSRAGVDLLADGFVMAGFTPLLLFPPMRDLVAELRRRERNLEWAAQFVTSAGLAGLVFLTGHAAPIGFVLFLPLLWGAARLGPVRAMAGMLVTAAIAITGIRAGRGWVTATAGAQQRMTVLLCLLTTLSVTVLLMLLSARLQRLATARAGEREQSLAESQRLVQLGSWTWDVATGEVTWSAQMYAVFGLDRARFHPALRNWIELVHPEDRARIQRSLVRAARTGDSWDTDFRLCRGDGQLRWIYSCGGAARDHTGVIREVRGTAQDVTDARASAQELAEARDLYHSVLSAVREQAIIGTDRAGLVTLFNAGAEKMLGYAAAEVIGRDTAMLHDPKEITARAAELGIPPTAAVLAVGVTRDNAQTRQWTFVTRDGRRLQVMITVTQIRDGRLVGYLGVASDVTAQRRAEAQLRESEERFRLAFDSASMGMYIATLDPARHTEITQVNAAMCEFVGRSPEQIVGHTLAAISDEAELAEAEAREIALAGGDLTRWRREVRFRHSDGREIWGLLSCSVVSPQFETPYVIALVEDITARKRAEDQLRHLALHDALTGLPNRLLLTSRIEHALTATGRSHTRLGLLYCDLDGFKQVNDSAGHPAGDELLVEAGARLAAVIRPGDTVARLGGDEFAILCTELTDPEELPAIAARALAALRAPFPLAAGMFTISASIGACVSGKDITTAEEFLHRADTAMYGAKRAGKDRFSMANPDEQARAARDTRLRPALETALTDDELIMYGQPIVDITTGAITGVETLLRWAHPQRGLITPDEFLDVAENSPLMVPIGRRVLYESCRMAAEWARLLGDRAPDVHVNVSGRQLASGVFAQDVFEAMEHTGMRPNQLVLELTETHTPLMADSSREDVIRLRECGVRLAIDDIGTGYSSLARITELPVDVLKIDLKFVQGLGIDPSCDAVVRAVLAIGRALDVEVVAEGVETPRQEQLLREYGCRLVQGFLLARPQPEHELTRSLNTGRRAARPGRGQLGRLGVPGPVRITQLSSEITSEAIRADTLA